MNKRVFFAGVKQPEREADHSSPHLHASSRRGVQLNIGYVFMVWYLVEHRIDFNFELRSGNQEQGYVT
jgi:hypothetical protein